MLKTAESLQDQYTDKSCKFFIKIASRLADQETAEAAYRHLLGVKHVLNKTAATFPCGTAADTFLSRIYFEAQRDNMSKEAELEFDRKLSIAEALFGVRPNVDFVMEKDAEEEDLGWELLDGVFYNSLEKAAEDFGDNYLQLDYADRVTFARNFRKYANYVPEHIAVYDASTDCEIRPDYRDQLHFRKLAADRAGKDGSVYDVLSEYIDKADTYTPDALNKLAFLVHEIDEKFGFTDISYDRRLPDAWHALVKKAEEKDEDKNVNNLTKSDVLARFGEDALDEVENPDGSINRERLKQIQRLFIGRDNKNTTEDNPTDEKV